VRTVAIRADSAGQKPFFDQALPVHAAGIVDHDRALLCFYGRLMIQFSVTIAAEFGNFRPVCFVSLVEMRKNFVFPVAVGAVGRVGVLLKVGLSMAAFEIIVGDLGVAVGAVCSACCLAGTVSLRVDVGMAFHAGNIAMHRILNILLVDRHGDLLFLDGFEHIVFLMTDKAFPVSCAKHQGFSLKLVWMVTVGAGRYGTGFSFPELSLDDFEMDFFNPGMAFGACCGDVQRRDGRSGIRVGENEMIAVAVVTGSRDDQPALEQSLSMDTLGIIGQNVVLWNVVNAGYGGSLPVTFAAEDRDVHLVGARIDGAGGQHTVVAMAFAAVWSIGSSSFQSSAMNSSIKFFVRFVMADSAVDSLESFRMGKVIHICVLVAVNTFNLTMYRGGIAFEIHIERNGSPPALSG